MSCQAKMYINLNHRLLFYLSKIILKQPFSGAKSVREQCWTRKPVNEFNELERFLDCYKHKDGKYNFI